MYTFNQHYFDTIDTADKAYWLGFIWADGYIAKREREYGKGHHRTEYNLKLSLGVEDKTHLEKFVECIDGNYPIHFYKTPTTYDLNAFEARVFITNKYMNGLLYEDYGIIPYRSNPSKILSHIPQALEKYFILGVFDGDGSFSAYQKETYGKKMNVAFGGSEELLRFIEKHLYNNQIITSLDHKLYHRHKNADGTWRTLEFAGKIQGMKILDYLYKDVTICLERKYNKYLALPYHNN